jgi:hypothetical protein
MTTIFTSSYLAHHCSHYTFFIINGTKTQLQPWSNYFTIILDFIMVGKLLISISLIFVLKFHTCTYVCQSMSKHFLTIHQLVSYHLYSQIPQDIYYLHTLKILTHIWLIVQVPRTLKCHKRNNCIDLDGFSTCLMWFANLCLNKLPQRFNIQFVLTTIWQQFQSHKNIRTHKCKSYVHYNWLGMINLVNSLKVVFQHLH